MRKRYNLYVHPHTSRKSANAVLFWAVTVDGVTKELPSGISVPVAAYDKKARAIVPVAGYSSAVVDNLHLQQGVSKWERIFTLLSLNDTLSLSAAIDAWASGGSEPQRLLALDCMDEFVKECSVVHQWGEGTVKKFGVLRSRIAEFDGTVSMDGITEAWLVRFMDYLSKGYPVTNKDGKVTMHSYRNTSLAKMLKQFRWWLRWASRKGVYHGGAEDFSMDFKGGAEPLSDIVYLTADELHLLMEHEWKPTELHLERVVDAFIFACYCGLRYSDIADLRRYHIHDDQIFTSIDKTKVKVIIPLNKVTRAILEKYASWDDGSGRPFPVCSNQKSNEYLKDAARACGIDSVVNRIWYVGTKRHEESCKKCDVLSFHCARRTFITQALVLGIPDSVLIQFTGHTTTKMLTRYQGVVDELKRQQISKFDEL